MTGSRTELVASSLATTFPSRRWTVEAWRGGVDYWADLVRERDGAIAGVVRSPRNEVLPTDYEGAVDFADILAKEVGVFALLTEHGLPVPAVLGWARRATPDAVSWLLCEHVEHDPAAPLTPEIQQQLGRLTARIHAIKPTEGLVGTSLSGATPAPSWPEHILDRIALRLRAAAPYCPFNSAQIEEVMLRATDLVANRTHAAQSLLHLDLRPTNILLRDDRIQAIIDVSNAMVGDPLLELARIRAYGLLTDDFLTGYGLRRDQLSSDGDLLDLYELDTSALLTVVACEEIDDRELFETSRTRTVDLTAGLCDARRRPAVGLEVA